MNVNSIAQKNKVSSQEQEMTKKLKEAAQGMEEQFANLLIQEMKKSVDRNEDGSTAMKIYESMLDQEYAKIMAEQGKLGIGDALIKQFSPQARGSGVYNDTN